MSVRWQAWAWEQDVQVAARKLVLLALADMARDDLEHAEDDGVCWPSVPTIGTRCGLSERQVRYHLDALCESGHVAKKHRRRRPDGSLSVWMYQVCDRRATPSGNPLPVDQRQPIAGGETRKPRSARKPYRQPIAAREPKEDLNMNPNRGSPPKAARDETLNTPKARPPDLLFEALADAVHRGWRDSGITPTARAKLNAALKELRSVDATPGEIKSAAGKWRSLYPNVPVTAHAIAGNWPKLVTRSNSHDDRLPDVATLAPF